MRFCTENHILVSFEDSAVFVFPCDGIGFGGELLACKCFNLFVRQRTRIEACAVSENLTFGDLYLTITAPSENFVKADEIRNIGAAKR